jgi:hypothetical protein
VLIDLVTKSSSLDVHFHLANTLAHLAGNQACHAQLAAADAVEAVLQLMTSSDPEVKLSHPSHSPLSYHDGIYAMYCTSNHRCV